MASERARAGACQIRANIAILYLSSQQRECGSWLKAMPWMDEGDMSITNSDLLVTTAMRYGLDLQPSAVPRQFCPCGHQGPFAPPSAVTAEEKSARAAVQRVWARHAMSCQKGAGRWSIAHDIICDIIVGIDAGASEPRVGCRGS